MPSFRSTIDTSKAAAAGHEGAEQGLRLAVEFLLSEANKTVPHDEGTLERSGSTDVDGTTGAVSYDTPYAARQHEDMTLHHDGKGQAKWLEHTFASEGEAALKIVAAAIRSKIGG